MRGIAVRALLLTIANGIPKRVYLPRLSLVGCDGASAYENVLLHVIVRAAGRTLGGQRPQCFRRYSFIFE